MIKEIYFVVTMFLVVSCSRSEVAGAYDGETSNTVAIPVVKTGNFELQSFNLATKGLIFPTTAVGRETKLGADDGLRLKITDNGICHPSIIYIPEGINGFQYWCAMTPLFGVVNKQADNTAFENPHVFCSKDGINWIEPGGINNPQDKSIKGPWLNYWSDTNLVYNDKKLYLYYRGCGFPYNFFGDKNMHLRATVLKESTDGINWSPRKLLYGSNKMIEGIDDQSVIASPSIVKDNGQWLCYDVVYSTAKNPYASQGNQTSGFVFRRTDTSPNGSFGGYSADKICKFENRPWGDLYDPWHLEVVKYDGQFFMLLSTGLIAKSNGDSLYLAYSKDGISFKVIPTPLFAKDTYKSAIVPESYTSENVTFKIYQSEKSTGKINLYRLTIKKT